MAQLQAIKGTTSLQTISLDKDVIVLGRNASCDIVFPANDFAVSREHARILRSQGRWFIEDLDSRNGTYVNDKQIKEKQTLQDGDKIKICDFAYAFQEFGRADRPAQAGGITVVPGPDELDDMGNIEAAVSHTSHLLLESQPAEKLRILVEITNNLSQTLELDTLLPKVVESLFNLFRQADRGFIILREEVTEREKTIEKLIPKVIKTRRVIDESQANFSRAIVRECLRTVQAFLSDDAAADKRVNMSQSIADFRIRSVMCAPLWSEDTKQAFGIIQLDTQDRGKKFTQEDLTLLMAVARQASTALENARLHQDLLARERLRRDVELAYEVQLSFLPKSPPQVPNYEFFSHYEPAQEVGGDYYGFNPMSAQRIAITLGDVAGKGVPAALLMAKLSSDARFAMLMESEPAKAISLLNDLLYPHTSQMDRFVTFVGAVLDPSSHEVTIVNAGHPPPLLIRRQAKEPEELQAEHAIGLPLGILEGQSYKPLKVVLEPGDSILIYSDGITDAMDKQNRPIQMKAVHTALLDGPREPCRIGERLVKLVRQHAAGRNAHDDITLVCFGRT